MFRSLALIAFALVLSAQTPAPPAQRKPASAFSVQDAHGKPVTLSTFKGKVLLLNFWATWCHGCIQELPWYNEFSSRYAGQGLSVLAVSMDDDGWKSVRPYVASHHLDLPVAIGNPAAAAQYKAVDELPVTCLIDRRGRVVLQHTGVVDRDAMDAAIRAALHEAAQ